MTSTAYDDQHAPEPTPAEEDAWRELEARQSTVKESLTAQPDAPLIDEGNKAELCIKKQINDEWAQRLEAAAESVVQNEQAADAKAQERVRALLARIAELEAQLEAIGAGGVTQGQPLMPGHTHEISGNSGQLDADHG